MSSAASEFWSEENEYQDIARQFEENIELTHPNRAKGECRHFCGRCCWAATSVKYYEYRGPKI